MTQHPIAPPPELVQQWLAEYFGYNSSDELTGSERFLATRAAQWGADQAEANIGHKLQKAADQELEACCEWLKTKHWIEPEFADELCAARRPKPPSLKEEAFTALGPEPLPETGPTGDTILNKGKIERHRIIRRALESIPDHS